MSGNLGNFCTIMRMACEDWSLGYDQDNRWDIRDGGECDCSSLVIWALRAAGFDTGAASYTGDMSSNLTARGWKRLPFSIANVKPGDILLNDEKHVCAVISGSGASATIAQASIDERGQARYGASGDQTGGETNTRQVYEYRWGWDCILRYTGPEAGKSDPQDGTSSTYGLLDVDGYIGPKTVTEWQRQLGTEQDGIVSGQAEVYSRAYPRLTSVTFEGGGSPLMVAMQKRIGVPDPTGVIAGGTVCMLQGWLVLHGYSCASDRAGVLGEATAKSLQRSLNDGKWS